MNSYICLDIETTGFNGEKDGIIEFAAIKFDLEKNMEEFSELVNPNIPIPEIVKNITGIKEELLKNKKPFSSHLLALKKFIGDLPIVGHNINFDTEFLQLKGVDLEKNIKIDTLELSAILLENQKSYSLESLCQDLKICKKQTHRAKDDVLVNIDLFRHLLKKIREIPQKKLEEIVSILRKSNWGAKSLFFDVLNETPDKSVAFPFLKKTNDNAEKNSMKPALDENLIADIFKENGHLNQILKNKHENRESQTKMASFIWDAFAGKNHLLCEAGAGTGKSLGYLLPALLSALKNQEHVVISTYTTNLQDQLATKDLLIAKKVLRKILGKSAPKIKATVLKGRKNYLSLFRLKKFLEKNFFLDHEVIALIKIILWLNKTKTGDLSETTIKGKECGIIPQINCAENLCPHENSAFATHYPCFLLKNRDSAKKSQIIITNHSLLLSDFLSTTPVLPAHKKIIIDEGHNLEIAATEAYSLNFIADHILSPLEDLTKIFRTLSSPQKNLFFTSETADIPQIGEKIEQETLIAFGFLGLFLKQYLPEEENIFREDIIIDDKKKDGENWKKILFCMEKINNLLQEYILKIQEFLSKQEGSNLINSISYNLKKLSEIPTKLTKLFLSPEENLIIWGNISREGLPYIKAAPIKISPYLKKELFQKMDSVIITSATLAVGHNFNYIKNQLGLEENCVEIILPSQFNYSKQCKIILVEDIPAPFAEGHLSSVEESVKNIIKKKRGRILVLLTSKAFITNLYHRLFPFCQDLNINLLAHGISGGKNKILQNFENNADQSILLGLNSFWEGVDLPGDLLTTVVIQKLPFDPPTDPLHLARGQLLHNSFEEYLIPRAIIKFKQGFGRLIRSNKDSGSLVILDSRIISKSYGELFISSLPPNIPIIYSPKDSLQNYL